ncbi:MAG: hypothetical protein AAF938_13050, partial [Myxococcota bacterium]
IDFSWSEGGPSFRFTRYKGEEHDWDDKTGRRRMRILTKGRLCWDSERSYIAQLEERWMSLDELRSRMRTS